MTEIQRIIDYLEHYKGPKISIMEVCGTHTSAIMKNGIREHLSPNIRLVSGPGCPVCVTPQSYIDLAAGIALKDKHVLVTFGDMMKVPGSNMDLYEVRTRGGRVKMVYSPMAILDLARENPDTVFVMAAVGFETTAPIYAMLIKKAAQEKLHNIKLLTAIKTIIPAMKAVLEEGTIDGFICPGHVSAITGISIYEPLQKCYNKPFTVTGFEGKQILAAIYDVVRSIEAGTSRVHNLYPSVVATEGNHKALALLDEVFMTCDAWWRGIGLIKGSGLCLKPEYKDFDAATYEIKDDEVFEKGCRCADVITGRINPDECPMFGIVCTPSKPHGACMVSSEGSCGIWFAAGNENTSRRQKNED
jgi:hydrogenase expression/formation protein HypD